MPPHIRADGGIGDGDRVVIVNDAESVAGPVVDQEEVAGAEPCGEAERAQAFADGEAAGRQAADAESARRCQELEAALQQLTSQLGAELNSYLAALEQQMAAELCDLAFAIAEQIVQAPLRDPVVAASLLEQVMAELPAIHTARVRLGTEYSEVFGRLQTPDMELQVDPELGPGDVIVETEQGQLDATLESRLRNMRTAIAERLANRGTNPDHGPTDIQP